MAVGVTDGRLEAGFQSVLAVTDRSHSLNRAVSAETCKAKNTKERAKPLLNSPSELPWPFFFDKGGFEEA